MATAFERYSSRPPWSVRGQQPTPPGVVLLVGVTEDSAFCYTTHGAESAAIDAGAADPNWGPRLELVGDVAESWEAALKATAEALPEVLPSRDARTSTPPLAIPLRRAVPASGRTLMGSSFGLALAVCAASRMLDQSVGSGSAFLATVRPGGVLGTVDGLERKIEAIEREAPSVTTLWVAPEQVDQARAFSAEKYRIQSAASVGELLHRVFDVQARFMAVWANVESRGQIVQPLFERSLEGTGATHAEREQASFAGRLLAAGVEDPFLRFKLAAARAFFMRHVDHSVGADDLDLGMVSRLPRHQRLATLRNLVQHVSDTGSPDLELLRPHVVRGLSGDVDERCVDQWSLAGAWVELLFHSGEHSAVTVELGRLLAFYSQYDQRAGTSHVARRAFWFAGAMGDVSLFERASLLWRATASEHKPGPRAFVESAAARAAAWLGDGDTANEWARVLVNTGHLWLDLARERTRRIASRRRGVCLDSYVPGRAATDPTVCAFEQMIALDDAIAAGDVAAGEAALAEAIRHLRYPLTHIVNTAERRGLGGIERLRWAQRMFPY